MKKIISLIVVLAIFVGLPVFVVFKLHSSTKDAPGYAVGGKTFTLAYEVIRDDGKWQEEDDSVLPAELRQQFLGVKEAQEYEDILLEVDENTFFKAAEKAYLRYEDEDEPINEGVIESLDIYGDLPGILFRHDVHLVFVNETTAYVKLVLGTYGPVDGPEHTVCYYAVYKVQ